MAYCFLWHKIQTLLPNFLAFPDSVPFQPAYFSLFWNHTIWLAVFALSFTSTVLISALEILLMLFCMFFHLLSTYQNLDQFILFVCLYVFLERGERKEKGRERNINVGVPLMHPLLGNWPTTQACALTGNWTNNPFICRPVFRLLSHTSQGKIWTNLKLTEIWRLYDSVPKI